MIFIYNRVGHNKAVESAVFKTLLRNIATVNDGKWTLIDEWKF